MKNLYESRLHHRFLRIAPTQSLKLLAGVEAVWGEVGEVWQEVAVDAEEVGESLGQRQILKEGKIEADFRE
jgi:hypothetical protein